MDALSAVAPFQEEDISQERSISFTCSLPGLKQDHLTSREEQQYNWYEEEKRDDTAGSS